MIKRTRIMAKLAFCLLCLLGLIALNRSSNPGLKLRLSQNGLNYAVNVGVDFLSDKLWGMSIPDQSGKTSIGFGKAEWKVSRMRITSFVKPHSSIQVNPGHGVTLTLSGGSIELDGDWKYKVKIIFTFRDHGTFEVSASGFDLTLSLAFEGKTSTGAPDIWTTGCSSTLSKVKVKLHGGASWLYYLFSKAINNKLKTILNAQVCEQVAKVVNENVRKSLSTLPTTISTKNMLDFDYSLVSDPAFAAGYIESRHKGEVYWRGDHTEAPFAAPAMPSLGQPSGMLQICLSSYILDTLGYVLQKHGLIKYTLAKSDLPSSQQGILNTTCQGGLCIGGLIPKLAELYPHKSIRINMEATIPPKTTFHDGVVEVNFYGTFIYEVEINATTTEHLFTTSVNAIVNGTGNFTGNRIIGKVLAINPELKVTNSSIGTFSDLGLRFVFGAASVFIRPKLNEIGQKGLVIPTLQDVAFSHPQIKLLKDVIVVSTDVEYSPGSTT